MTTEIENKRKELEKNRDIYAKFIEEDIKSGNSYLVKENQQAYNNVRILDRFVTLIEGYNLGVEMARKEIISRETKMECLSCGISLYREIMDKKIHIHLCRDCRIKELDKFIGEKAE